MSRARLLVSTVALLLAGASNAAAAPPRASDRTILVKPLKGHALDGVANAAGARVKAHFPAIGDLQVVELPPGLSVEKAIAHYKRSGHVAYAEPDFVVSAVATPNDPAFVDGTLWGLDNTGQAGGTLDADVDAPEAWDVRTDSSAVTIAIIDTGIRYTHEDLVGSLWTNPGEIPNNGIDDDRNGIVDDYYGARFIGGVASGDPLDDHGHGTHVAGTIGATGNNGKGVVGVAWKARIMALKFLDANGSGFVSDAVMAVDYARAKGARVMSNSWGGGGFSTALYDAIVAARDANVLFVAAAGNGSADIDGGGFYPAGYDVANVVAVAATDRNDLLASFSNWGARTVELGAPGVSIYSTWGAGDTAYATLNGTSMACPHVSGAAALLWAQRPNAGYAEIITRLEGTSDPIPALDGLTISGGRLNVSRALAQDPVAYFVAIAGGDGFTVAFTDRSIGAITSRSLDFGDGTPPTSSTTTSHTYTAAGTYTAELTVTGPNGTATSTRRIDAVRNYVVDPGAFAWIDPSAMTQLTLGDDTVSAVQPLPFPFTFFGQAYGELYVGSNGLVGFSSTGLTAYANTDVPTGSTPNSAIYGFWDDLNPGTGGAVRIGTVGVAPNRSVVVSWVGVPHYSDAAAQFTFQVVLHETSGDIEVQYLDVAAANTVVGGGRSATVGVEDATGGVGRRYSLNGSPLLANGQAIRFHVDTPAVPSLSVSPGDGLSASGRVGGPFTPTTKSYTLANTGGGSLSWSASRLRTWTALSSTSGTLGPGASTVVTVSINAAANSLGAGSYSDTVSFTNTSTHAGDTTRPVALAVTPNSLGAPTGLTATVSAGPRISLRWTDNATGETGFAIQRAVKTSGWGAFAPLTTVGANTTTFNDSTVTAGRWYRYRVRAVAGSTTSAWSSIVQVRVR